MDFKKRVIDGHYHIYNWYNEENRDFFSVTEEYIKEANFRTININALPSVEQDVSNNIIAALFKLKHPESFAHGGLVYDSCPVTTVPEGMDSATQYRELMEIGFDGIKMLETKPTLAKALGIMPDNEFYEGLFENAEKNGTHIVWHVADTFKYWDPEKAPRSAIENGWYYGDGTYPTYEEIFRSVYRVLERHPQLKVTFAHFFFLSKHPQYLVELFERFPNVNIDLTPGTEMYESFGERRAFYRDFFTRYADRIGYGTDCCEDGILENKMRHSGIIYRFLTTDDEFDVWDCKFKGLKLDSAAQDKILCDNFIRRVSVKPKPINKPALVKYFEKYRRLIENEKIIQNIEDELNKLP